jgi:hypothetical protein
MDLQIIVTLKAVGLAVVAVGGRVESSTDLKFGRFNIKRELSLELLYIQMYVLVTCHVTDGNLQENYAYIPTRTCKAA